MIPVTIADTLMLIIKKSTKTIAKVKLSSLLYAFALRHHTNDLCHSSGVAPWFKLAIGSQHDPCTKTSGFIS